MNTNTIFSNINSYVVEDWNGGYKLHLDLTSASDIKNWKLNFDLPNGYDIYEIYGVDIVENNNGNYTIRGKDGWVNLSEGQSIQSVLIVKDNGQEASSLKFNTPSSFSSSNSSDSPDTSSSPEAIQDSEPQDVAPAIDNNGTIINVDRDHGGDLASAIASANDGEAIELSGKTYYTSGLTIDKDITVFGQEGTIIDGGGTSNSIIRINPGASGATIRDIDITNGNNGIHSYGASNLTLQNLDVYNIGKTERISGGQNNTGIILNYANGVNLTNSRIYDVGRNGVSVGDTNGANISGLTVENINLAAEHAQSHDAAGIKFFNTNDVFLRDSYFTNINANNIWNDTTNKTIIENNTIENVGSAFVVPSFTNINNVDISGIYNEKSSNSVVRYNSGTSVDNFAAYNATEFTTETMVVEDNYFSIIEINTEDYWVNEYAEKLIATTEDPAAADFNLISEEYLAVAIID